MNICNVSFYLEMGSDYVISKSEDHLAPPFLHFCKKYDICSLNRGAFNGAYARYLLACQPFSPISKNQYLVVLTISCY